MANSSTLKALTENFKTHFGAMPTRLFQAPGRVNLIGEHTDYNDGFVLPCAIDYQTLVAVTPREDKQIKVVAADYDNQTDEFTISPNVDRHPTQLWSNYIRGVVKHMQLRDLEFKGANLVVSGNVPQGAGLSSSASLEVVIGATFRGLYQLPISLQDVAVIGQQAENQFVGCKCGIMDQLISACGAKGQGLLLDCRTLETKLINMPDDLSVMIINSNVKRGLVDSEYNLRRTQCEQAAHLLGEKALRDVNMGFLEAHKQALSEVVYRRARHVVSENERTLQAAEALESADYATLSRLMAESHRSMRDDFEISVKPIDFIVESMSELIGDKGGVRMTGGGFGGCVIALLPHQMVENAKSMLENRYHAATGYNASVYICTACDGAGEILL